jgi:hypothetical protein
MLMQIEEIKKNAKETHENISKEVNEFLKWSWMMGYCHGKGLPTAHVWAWERAERAYNEHIKEENGKCEGQNCQTT